MKFLSFVTRLNLDIATFVAYPVIIIIWDAILAAILGYPGTISSRALGISSRYPVVAAMIGMTYGFLLAHLFFPQIVGQPIAALMDRVQGR